MLRFLPFRLYPLRTETALKEKISRVAHAAIFLKEPKDRLGALAWGNVCKAIAFSFHLNIVYLKNSNLKRLNLEWSKYDLVALMDVEASCFKDSSQVFTCAVDRHVANEYFGRLPEQDCKDKAFCVLLKEVSSRTHEMESSTLSRFPLYANPPSFLTASWALWQHLVVSSCSRLFKVVQASLKAARPDSGEAIFCGVLHELTIACIAWGVRILPNWVGRVPENGQHDLDHTKTQ